MTQNEEEKPTALVLGIAILISAGLYVLGAWGTSCLWNSFFARPYHLGRASLGTVLAGMAIVSYVAIWLDVLNFKARIS